MSMRNELLMPSNYTLLDEDEMMYVSGGWKVKKSWKGIDLVLTATETDWFIKGSNTAGTILAGALGLAGGPSAPAVAFAVGAISAVFGLTMEAMNADNSGVSLRWDWIKVSTLQLCFPTVVDNG